MKLLLIHLSDIHITTEDDAIIGRQQHIANAVKNLDHTLDTCVVVVSGDVAYSGTADQYVVAFEFLANLKESLSARLPHTVTNDPISVHFIIVPGNHDCDFTTSGPLREVVTTSILDDNSRATEPDIVRTCTATQDSFFDFLGALEPSPGAAYDEEYDARLSYKYQLPCGPESITFVCYNTAWLSQLEESPGRLFFPPQAARPHHNDSALVVASFHHPYNWLEPTAARAFRDNVESTADLILTGHEHAPSLRAQDGSLGQHNLYVEGGVLQDPAEPGRSGFNAFVFDTATHKKKFANFLWDRDTYRLTAQSSLSDDGSDLRWTDYRINGLRAIDRTQISDQMRHYLDDPGLSLRHGERGVLTLRDVFVHPDLVEVRIQGDRFGGRTTGDRLVELLESSPKMIITGDTESGKTSLAKRLFLDLLDHGVVPILVHGTDGAPRSAKIHDHIEQLLVKQYDVNLLETYRQTDISRRALIIDDYDRLPLSRPQKKDLLKALSSSVHYLVILSHDMTSDLDELASPGGLSGSSEDMVHYRIQPLGYVGRNKLVEQWIFWASPRIPQMVPSFDSCNIRLIPWTP